MAVTCLTQELDERPCQGLSTKTLDLNSKPLAIRSSRLSFVHLESDLSYFIVIIATTITNSSLLFISNQILLGYFLKSGKIDLTEFKSIELERMRDYIAALLNDSSLRRIASSKISWLWHDEDELLRYQPELLDGFHERYVYITTGT